MFYGQFLLLGAFLGLIFAFRLRRKLHRPRYILPLVFVILLFWVAGGYCFWFLHRPSALPERRELAPGITYIREVRSLPRMMVVHRIEFDLDQPGLTFLVTPGDPAGNPQLRARTTTDFVREFGVQVAINASFFTPWHANSPFDYYPHRGDPCEAQGLSASQGKVYSAPLQNMPTLNITQDNRASISDEPHELFNAVSGMPQLLKAGVVPTGLRNHSSIVNPMTAVAIDATGRKMWWIVVDGRQPRFSEGISIHELADLCQELGAWDALALDGGGSSTMVARGVDGEPEILNSPIHGQHPPGRERPVANHLGAYLRRE